MTFQPETHFISHEMTTEMLNAMMRGSTILEQDARGMKVMQCADGQMFKIFRIRNKISGARIYSYARRFIRNANRLEKREVPTVKPNALYHFSGTTDTAVLYSPLAGQTLKQILYTGDIRADLMEKLGYFVANLHHKGIHFRSLHMGNIVLTADNRLGLIDISDMTIYPWPLFINTRVRSFKHICRYSKDIEKMGSINWHIFLAAYFNHTQLSDAAKSKFCASIQKYVPFN